MAKRAPLVMACLLVMHAHSAAAAPDAPPACEAPDAPPTGNVAGAPEGKGGPEERGRAAVDHAARLESVLSGALRDAPYLLSAEGRPRLRPETRDAFARATHWAPESWDIVFQRIGSLRDAYLNRGRLAEFVSPYRAILEEARHVARGEGQRRLERAIAEVDELVRTAPPVGKRPAGDRTPPSMTDAVARVASDLKAQGFVPRKKADLELLSRAILEAPPGAFAKVIEGYRGRAPLEAALKAMGEEDPRGVLSLHEKTGVLFFGFTQGDHAFFLEQVRRHPAAFAEVHRGATAVVASNEGANEYRANEQSVVMWGERFLSSIADANERAGRSAERERVFLHEWSHGLATRYPEFARAWADEFFEITDGAYRAKGGPFVLPESAAVEPRDVEAVMTARRGFVSGYATVNPDEDIAESGAEYFTNPGRLREINPDKYARLHALFSATVRSGARRP